LKYNKLSGGHGEIKVYYSGEKSIRKEQERKGRENLEKKRPENGKVKN